MILDDIDSPAFGPWLLAGVAALLLALVIFVTGGEGSMPEPLTTLPTTVYPAKEEEP
jgi:hypothetical protein